MRHDASGAEHYHLLFGTSAGKYIERLRTSSNVVVNALQVADPFPNAAAVNAALRSFAEIAKRRQLLMEPIALTRKLSRTINTTWLVDSGGHLLEADFPVRLV